MSTFKVPLTTIKEILPLPNSDFLEIAKVYDFNVVVGKGQYKVGDVAIYVPIDSILPHEIESKVFGSDSKIKLNKSRVKQIKIRGAYSQGLLLDPKTIGIPKDDLEYDLAPGLGIVKYEPPAPKYQLPGFQKQKPKENPNFSKYGGIDNFKWYPDLFAENEPVSITEKIHGSNIRFGMVPYVANNWFRKILKFFKLTPEFEWVYGSNNVQLQQRISKNTFYGDDVYGKILAKYDAKNKVKPGEIWYGELYGDGIQKGYNYGCKSGEHKMIVFDMKRDDFPDTKFQDAGTFRQFAILRGFETPPELYCGPFNKDAVKELTKGPSVLAPEQKVREGIVIKPLKEENSYMGRKLLKVISEKYLESDQTDFH